MFTQPNLAELVSPIAPDPVSRTSSNRNGNGNREEYSSSGRAVLLVELVSLAFTFVWETLVQFQTALAGRDGNASVTSWIKVLDGIFVRFAEKRMVWRGVAFWKFTCAIGLAFVVEVTISH